MNEKTQIDKKIKETVGVYNYAEGVPIMVKSFSHNSDEFKDIIASKSPSVRISGLFGNREFVQAPISKITAYLNAPSKKVLE